MEYTEIQNRYYNANLEITKLMQKYQMIDLGAIPIGIERKFCKKFKVEFTESGDIINLTRLENKLKKLSKNERLSWRQGEI